VKRTCNTSIDMESIEHTIKNGIKNTEPGGYLGPITIRGKVFHQFESSNKTSYVGDVIENGVKETKPMDEWVNTDRIITKVIYEAKELPDQSGNLRGYGDYYNRQEDRTKPHTKYVDEVVSQGEKY
jgi:hypothetical protein